MASGFDPPRAEPDAVRLAVLQERLNILIDSLKEAERRQDNWRRDTADSLTRVSDRVDDIGTRLDRLESRTAQVEVNVATIGTQISNKAPIWPFKTAWVVLAAMMVVVSTVSGLINVLHTVGFFH